MKKTILLLSVFFGTFLVSCDEDLLDPYTPGALTEEVAITNSAQLKQLLLSSYSLITPVSEIEFNSIFTDEVGIAPGNGGQGLGGNYDFLLNSSSSSPYGIWATHYSALSYINRVIKFSNTITIVDSADQQLVDQIVAEALTLRAYCHIQLISYFSTNPKDLNALGVMLSNDVYPSNFEKPRATNGEIYQQIEDDLNSAVVKFGSSSFDPIYASKYFAIALKARAAALKGDYTNALVYANDVINNSGVALSDATDNRNIYWSDNQSDNSEVLFKLKKLNGQTKIGTIWASVNATATGGAYFDMGRGLFNLLQPTNLPTASAATITSIASGKNVRIPNHGLSVNDMVVLNSDYGTSSTNKLKEGHSYFVFSVVDANTVTLSNQFGGTQRTNLVNNASLSINCKTNYGDTRYSTMVAYTSSIDVDYLTSADFRTSDFLVISKYPGTTANGNLVNDIKICRISEMYFIKAEAQIHAGLLADAANTLKAIRDKRYSRSQPAPSYANAQEAWKDVLKERRIEFAFEGYRFIDLKRLGLLANEGIVRDNRDCEINGACSLPVTDYRFTLPIPISEITANGAISGQQNPQY